MIDLFEVREKASTAGILVGGVFLVVGVMLFSALGNIYSASLSFSGLLLVVFGLFSKLGVFWVNFRSWNGLSVILICAAVAFFALSITLYQFSYLVVKGYRHQLVIGDPHTSTVTPQGTIIYWAPHKYALYLVHLMQKPMFMAETQLFLTVGGILLVVGVVLRLLKSVA